MKRGRGNPRRRRGRRLPGKWPTSSWPLFLRASSLLSSSPLELHPLSVYEISSIVMFDIAEIESLVKFFFSFFWFLVSTGPTSFTRGVASITGSIKTTGRFLKGHRKISAFHRTQKLSSSPKAQRRVGLLLPKHFCRDDLRCLIVSRYAVSETITGLGHMNFLLTIERFLRR